MTRESYPVALADSTDALNRASKGFLSKSAEQKGSTMEIMKRLALALFFMWAIAYAEGQDVHYNYDRGANYRSYKTYQWVEIPSSPANATAPVGLPKPPGAPDLPPPPSFPGSAPDLRAGASDGQLLYQDIRCAVDEQLAQKGLSKVEKNGDILVTFHAALREEKSLNLSGSGWRSYGMLDGSVQGQTTTIPVGTLVIDMYDPARKQLIWRGDASKAIDIKKDPDKNYKNLQKAMAKLFKNYPPQSNK